MDGCYKMLLAVFVIGLVALLLLGGVGGVVYLNRDKLGIPSLEEWAQGSDSSGENAGDAGNGSSGAGSQTVNRPVAATAPMHVDTASFSRAIQRPDVLVLVDYYADWCGPCRQLAPSLAKLAQEHGDKVIVLKVNVDAEKQLAGQAGVRSIPDVRILHNGREVDRFIGLIPYERIEKMILKHESLLPPPQKAPSVQQAGGEGTVDPVTGRYLPPGISRGK